MIKMLTEKAGALQGMDVDSIAQAAYGPDAYFLERPHAPTHPAVIARGSEGSLNGHHVLDHVIEVHDV